MNARTALALAMLGACKSQPIAEAPDASAPPPPTPTASASASATPYDAARALADADLESALARAPIPVPPGTKIGVTCCMESGVAGAPAVAAVSLLLPAPADAPSAPRPTVGLGAGYQIDLHATRILARPDLDAVRSAAPAVAADATTAYGIAHDKLVSLPRYAGWKRPLSYATSLIRTPGSGARAWVVYFRAPDDTIDVSVDLDKRAVTAIHAGAAHTPL